MQNIDENKKRHWYTNNIKWKIMNFKKFVLKIVCVIISMTIKLEVFEFDNTVF